MNRNLRQITILLLPVVLGLATGIFAMWVSWQQNTQCEIHCAEEGISWGYWLAIGLSWFIATSATLSLFVFLTAFLFRRMCFRT
jgi:hypothetical protein